MSMRLKRLFLLCGVGLVIPSVFLIYLGFSSLQTERWLREKEVPERLGVSVEAWRLMIEAALQKTMEAHQGWQFSAVMDDKEHWIEPFRESVPFSWPALPPHRAGRLAAIERMESVQKDYLKAADAYNLLAWDLENVPWKAALLLRAAGCWRKAGAWPQAKESLTHIGRGFSDVRNEHGTPFGLIAATEFAEVCAASGQTNLAIDKALDTLANIARPAWLVSWKVAKLFAQRLHADLGEWAPQMTETQEKRWRTFAQEFNARAERVQMLEAWRAGDWPRVQAILQAQGRMNRPTLIWPEHHEDLALWINPEIDPESGQRARTQIAWCDRTVIEALWQHSVRGSSDQAGFTATLQPVSKSTVDGVKCRLITIVPSVELAIRATGSSSDAYASTRKKIFWAIILLAGVILGSALRVAWHALAREADVEEHVAWLNVRFVDNLSPKIKTPLAILEFIAQKIRLKGYRNSQEAAEYYAMLLEDATRLKRVIDDVLDFSRVMDDRVPYPFVRFDWLPSLRETLDVFQQSEWGHGVTIDFTSSLTACIIEGHAEALSRVVLNVLENAVKYSPPERVDICVLMRQEGDHVLVDIMDHGDGISRSEQALVFDRFYRGASAQERSVSGVGLGLAVARYIIEAHQGTLTLQSVLGKGTTFTIRLPLFPMQ